MARQGRGRIRLEGPAARLARWGNSPDPGSAARGAGAPGASPAVSMRGITKRFPGVLANDARRFRRGRRRGARPARRERRRQEHALEHPDRALPAGRGRDLPLRRAGRFGSPSDAIDAGIGMVHQHFRLVPPFTVAENILLGEHRARPARSSSVRARSSAASPTSASATGSRSTPAHGCGSSPSASSSASRS